VARSTVYRVLVRNHLVEPRARRRKWEDYIRWERPEAMQLWQLDVTTSLFLTDGSESISACLDPSVDTKVTTDVSTSLD
jgi:hypothetical protein